MLYFCNSLSQSGKLRIDFEQYGDIPRLQPTLEISIYRIVQELVQNIIKHAFAKEAFVQLSCVEHKILSISVDDNGIGFNHDKMDKNAGMGLNSIHSRVRALNGMMDLRSVPEKGTSVLIEFDIASMRI